MMINPSIDQLTKGGQFNRYALVIATAKCAKVVTDDYVAQRERAEKMIADKKPIRPSHLSSIPISATIRLLKTQFSVSIAAISTSFSPRITAKSI